MPVPTRVSDIRGLVGAEMGGIDGVEPRRNLLGYNARMIRSFKHKGLEKFYRTGSTAGLQAAHVKRLRLILSNLDQAESPDDMDLPGLRLHELTGRRKGVWSVTVNGNWRVTFRFDGKVPAVVDYEDYH